MVVAGVQGAANGEPVPADMRALVYNQAVAGGGEDVYAAVAARYVQVRTPDPLYGGITSIQPPGGWCG